MPKPSRCSTRSRLHTGQAGYTLIEVIIAIALAGMVILSLAAGMLTIVRTNALNSDRQRVDAAMTSFSESVRGAEYLPCGNAANYNDAYFDLLEEVPPPVWAPPDGLGIEIDRVEYWDRDQDDFVASCPGSDAGAQRLTLETTYRDLERSAQIVKRR